MMAFDEWREEHYMFDNEWEMDVAKAAWEYQQKRIDELEAAELKLKAKIARLDAVVTELLKGSAP